MQAIQEILPDYDKLPDLLDDQQVARITGLKRNTLAADRCGARKLGLPWVKCGRSVKYPKIQLAKWLLKNAVGLEAA